MLSDINELQQQMEQGIAQLPGAVGEAFDVAKEALDKAVLAAGDDESTADYELVQMIMSTQLEDWVLAFVQNLESLLWDDEPVNCLDESAILHFSHERHSDDSVLLPIEQERFAALRGLVNDAMEAYAYIAWQMSGVQNAGGGLEGQKEIVHTIANLHPGYIMQVVQSSLTRTIQVEWQERQSSLRILYRLMAGDVLRACVNLYRELLPVTRAFQSRYPELNGPPLSMPSVLSESVSSAVDDHDTDTSVVDQKAEVINVEDSTVIKEDTPVEVSAIEVEDMPTPEETPITREETPIEDEVPALESVDESDSAVNGAIIVEGDDEDLGVSVVPDAESDDNHSDNIPAEGSAIAFEDTSPALAEPPKSPGIWVSNEIDDDLDDDAPSKSSAGSLLDGQYSQLLGRVDLDEEDWIVDTYPPSSGSLGEGRTSRLEGFKTKSVDIVPEPFEEEYSHPLQTDPNGDEEAWALALEAQAQDDPLSPDELQDFLKERRSESSSFEAEETNDFQIAENTEPPEDVFGEAGLFEPGINMDDVELELVDDIELADDGELDDEGIVELETDDDVPQLDVVATLDEDSSGLDDDVAELDESDSDDYEVSVDAPNKEHAEYADDDDADKALLELEESLAVEDSMEVEESIEYDGDIELIDYGEGSSDPEPVAKEPVKESVASRNTKTLFMRPRLGPEDGDEITLARLERVADAVVERLLGQALNYEGVIEQFREVDEKARGHRADFDQECLDKFDQIKQLLEQTTDKKITIQGVIELMNQAFLPLFAYCIEDETVFEDPRHGAREFWTALSNFASLIRTPVGFEFKKLQRFVEGFLENYDGSEAHYFDYADRIQRELMESDASLAEAPLGVLNRSAQETVDFFLQLQCRLLHRELYFHRMIREVWKGVLNRVAKRHEVGSAQWHYSAGVYCSILWTTQVMSTDTSKEQILRRLPKIANEMRSLFAQYKVRSVVQHMLVEELNRLHIKIMRGMDGATIVDSQRTKSRIKPWFKEVIFEDEEVISVDGDDSVQVDTTAEAEAETENETVDASATDEESESFDGGLEVVQFEKSEPAEDKDPPPVVSTQGSLQKAYEIVSELKKGTQVELSGLAPGSLYYLAEVDRRIGVYHFHALSGMGEMSINKGQLVSELLKGNIRILEDLTKK